MSLSTNSRSNLISPGMILSHVRASIQVDKKVKERLRRLKIHPSESYNAVLERLIQLQVDECDLSKETVREIERGLEDARAGRTISMKEVKERLGMK